MAFFKRNKGKGSDKSTGSSSPSEASHGPAKEDVSEARTTSPGPVGTGSSKPPLRETSPQRVGVVSGILTTSATLGGSSPVGDGDIVNRHFGPETARADSIEDSKKAERRRKELAALPPQHEYLRAVENRPEEEVDIPKLEVDPMAHVGHETTITGSIVAKEDLEIQGTIEGSIRLADHQLTVGSDGLVKANVEAHTVLVLGRISGDVVAAELVEIKAGGVIGGDVKSPRVIMHDGGVVVGGLDMSAALPSSGQSGVDEEVLPERPKLIRVEPPADLSKDGDRG